MRNTKTGARAPLVVFLGDPLHHRLDKPMNEDFQKFVTYLGASDELLEQATEKQIAEDCPCACVACGALQAALRGCSNQRIS